MRTLAAAGLWEREPTAIPISPPLWLSTDVPRVPRTPWPSGPAHAWAGGDLDSGGWQCMRRLAVMQEQVGSCALLHQLSLQTGLPAHGGQYLSNKE